MCVCPALCSGRSYNGLNSCNWVPYTYCTWLQNHSLPDTVLLSSPDCTRFINIYMTMTTSLLKVCECAWAVLMWGRLGCVYVGYGTPRHSFRLYVKPRNGKDEARVVIINPNEQVGGLSRLSSWNKLNMINHKKKKERKNAGCGRNSLNKSHFLRAAHTLWVADV